MNLGNLRSHMIALLNRSDITNALADTFIDQSIKRIQRVLRIPSMEATQNYSITTQTASIVLPNDFLELIELHHASKSIQRLPQRIMNNNKLNTQQGSPDFFTRVGVNLSLIHI